MKREEWIILIIFIVLIGYNIINDERPADTAQTIIGKTTTAPSLRFVSPESDSIFNSDTSAPYSLLLVQDMSEIRRITLTTRNADTSYEWVSEIPLPATLIDTDAQQTKRVINLLYRWVGQEYEDKSTISSGGYSSSPSNHRYHVEARIITNLNTYIASINYEVRP